MRRHTLYIGALTALLLLASSTVEARMHAPYRGHRIIPARTAAEIMAAAALSYDFAAGTYSQAGVPGCVSAATCLTTTRAGTGATNLLPTSPSGYAYTTYPADTARITPGSGILIEASRFNRLINAAAPVTQTTPSLNCSAGCVLWVNGSGSATPAAGTATGCTGFAAASQGVATVFTCSGNGTVTVTVAGSLNAFQLENGLTPTSFIATAGAAVQRALDVVTVTAPPVFGSAYSFLANATPLAAVGTATNQAMLAVDDGTTTNAVYLRRNATTGQLAFAGTSAFGPTSTAPAAAGSLFKSAGAADAASAAGAFGAELVPSAVGILPPGLNTVRVGLISGGGQPATANISQIAYWPIRLTDGDLLRVVQ